MLSDAPSRLPGYQRRLVVGGYLHRHGLGRGLSNLTGAGLDLGDRIVDVVLERAERLWPLELLGHPPLLADPWQHEFASQMSEHFDCFRLPGDRFLWFDTAVAHLDALRERLGASSTPVAVVSVEGLYRPVAAPRPLIRDEYIFPFAGLHVATRQEDVPACWAQLTDLTGAVAAAVGLPLLLVRRPGPPHYARECLAALLPAPGGALEPWMLAYELGGRFDDYLAMPGFRVLELGVSQRVIALAAHLQDHRAAHFGSDVCPTQVFLSGPGEPPAGLRCAPKPTGDIRRCGLAPVLADLEKRTYRTLGEEYRRTWPLERPVADLLAEHDRTLMRENTRSLAEFLGAHHSTGVEPEPGDRGQIVVTPFAEQRGRFLRAPTPRGARPDHPMRGGRAC